MHWIEPIRGFKQWPLSWASEYTHPFNERNETTRAGNIAATTFQADASNARRVQVIEKNEDYTDAAINNERTITIDNERPLDGG